jgi:hypothetical protein
MSKFAKKKSNKLVKYEKCPTLPLLSYAYTIAKESYIETGEEIKNVYIVDDLEGKVVYRDSSLYITTQFMMDSVQTYYEINFERDQYDSYEAKKYIIENKNNGEVYKDRTHSNRRNDYNYRRNRNRFSSTNKAIQALDILFYMKERDKACISTSTKAKFKRLDRYSSSIDSRNENFKLSLTTPYLISERLEFTRIQNEFLDFHKDNVETCNKIRECKNTLDLLINYNFKTVGDIQVSKVENLFLELGGQAYVS